MRNFQVDIQHNKYDESLGLGFHCQDVRFLM